MELGQAIGCRVRELCAQQQIKLYCLAKRTGLPPSTLYAIASGKRKDPLLFTIVKISAAFGLTTSEFFSSELFEA